MSEYKAKSSVNRSDQYRTETDRPLFAATENPGAEPGRSSAINLCTGSTPPLRFTPSEAGPHGRVTCSKKQYASQFVFVLGVLLAVRLGTKTKTLRLCVMPSPLHDMSPVAVCQGKKYRWVHLLSAIVICLWRCVLSIPMDLCDCFWDIRPYLCGSTRYWRDFGSNC